jgi:Ser/Thr protein kinase RdoA (MazF antagonist)
MDITVARQILQLSYNITPNSLELLKSEPTRTIFKVIQDHEAYILRIYGDKVDDACLECHANTLVALEKTGFAAPSIVFKNDHKGFLDYRHPRSLLTRFITGKPCGFDCASLGLLGNTLGSLHALPAELVSHASTFRPEVQADKALQHLRSVLTGSSERHREIATFFAYSLGKADNFRSTPVTLVHTDAFPENAVSTPDGRLVLIDWDDSGLGECVLDVAYMLATCESDQEYSPELQPDPRRICAIMQGYVKARVLTEIEKMTLETAIAFYMAVYGAWSLPKPGMTDVPEFRWGWWWARHRAAKKTAEVALSYA